MTKYYTGIGSRKTPIDVQKKMRSIARKLESMGYVLRSGGAQGADQAFQSGIENPTNMEIYIPWNGFNGMYHQQRGIIMPKFDTKLMSLAESYHPAWNRLSMAEKQLHTRNGCQVLGEDLDKPSDFVITWTANGKDVGGTAQALRIARGNNITIINLFHETFNFSILELAS